MANKYWYEKLLISETNKLLSRKKFVDAFTDWMLEHNQGHSGWVSEVDRIFHEPKNKKEKELAKRLRALVLKVTQGLLETIKPTANLMEFMDVEAIGVCLLRLDKDAPIKLVDDLLDLMSKCKELGRVHGGLIVPLEESIPKLKKKISESVSLSQKP